MTNETHFSEKKQEMRRSEIKSIDELLGMDLVIPDYQRPYKWSVKNVSDLLNDITHALGDESDKGNKYRVGTVILCKEADNKPYEIVDGQQRIITFLLIKLALGEPIPWALNNREFCDPISQNNIHDNYKYIDEYLEVNKQLKEDISKALNNILEAVVLVVTKKSEAFQLFDSQNMRGRELDPHDLLKAYHLRAMKKYPFEMRRAVVKWESIKPKDIRPLFSNYLFPILRWTHNKRYLPFTAKEIDNYKGVREDSPYSYAARTKRAMPYFQLSEPIVEGNDFFEMTEYYLNLLHFVQKMAYEEINKLDSKAEKIIKESKSTGFKYAKLLFECVMFCYYDRFRNFDKLVVKKLFTWAFMIRVDMENLPFDTINKYALGLNEFSKYTNTIDMFSVIRNARLHEEIAALKINVLNAKGHNVIGDNDGKTNDYNNATAAFRERLDLYKVLKRINGLKEDNDEQ